MVPDLEKLASWAAANGADGQTPEELVADPRILSIFQEIVDRWNKGKPHEQMIRKFALVPSEFTIEGGELTPNLSVKRRVVDTKFKALIDSMYVGSGD